MSVDTHVINSGGRTLSIVENEGNVSHSKSNAGSVNERLVRASRASDGSSQKARIARIISSMSNISGEGITRVVDSAAGDSLMLVMVVSGRKMVVVEEVWCCAVCTRHVGVEMATTLYL